MLHLDQNDPFFQAMAAEAFNRAAQQYFERQPTPDPQYTTAQAADLLGTTPETICDYLKLPATHPRHLPHVPITESRSGRRILLSDLTAWQQRNRRIGEPAPEPEMVISKRPARRRRAAA